MISQILQQYVRNNPPKESIAHPQENLREIEQEIENHMSTHHPSIASIPRFFFGKKIHHEKLQSNTHADLDIIKTLLHREAQLLLSKEKSLLILNNSELDLIWDIMMSLATPPIVESSERINYVDFCTAMKKLLQQISAEKMEEYFNADIFFRFFRDETQRISIPAFFNYILRKNSLIQNLGILLKYDSDGDGMVTEYDIQSMVLDAIPSIPSLRKLQKSFYTHYSTTAARKFFFFLDFKNRGKIPISTLLGSTILVEYVELQAGELRDEHEEMNNWFSAPSTLSVYNTFVKLDKDGNGLLSRSEFKTFNRGTLTDAFINRLYQENATKNGEMDYKTFVNFLLAYENKNTEAALNFYWNILDVDKKGYLTPFNINFFFREITSKLQESGDAVSVKDLIEEIYAMIKPIKDPHQIAKEEFIMSKCGGTVVQMLTDVNGFLNYDSREANLDNSNNDSNVKNG